MITKLTYIERVHDLVRRIPKGRVTTYGTISKALEIDPRMVGYALHQNKDPKVPCHRVVNKAGRLAPAFSFGGAMEQKRRLEAEGVRFADEMHVNLERSLHPVFKVRAKNQMVSVFGSIIHLAPL